MLCEACHRWKSTSELKGHRLFSFFGLLRRQATWVPEGDALVTGAPVPMPWQFKPRWTHSDGTVRLDDPSLTALSLSALRICSSAGPCRNGRARPIDLWVKPDLRTLELTDRGGFCSGQYLCTIEPT